MKYLQTRMYKLSWICLLCLSIGIFLWPVEPSPYDPLPVQSISAIKHLSEFVVVFILWVFNLATLLFFIKGNIWERSALCLVFVLVFVHFWGFKVSPLGNSPDSSWLMGHVTYLEQMTIIPRTGHPMLTYFDFPGLTLVGSALKQVNGTNLFLTVRIFLIINGLCFVAVLYTSFLKLLSTPRNAAIGVVLAISGSSVLGTSTTIFHPISLATTFISIFFLILLAFDIKGFTKQKLFLILICILIASTIEYMFTPVLFSMILFSNYLFHRMVKSKDNVSISLIILSLVLFLTWQIFGVIWMLRASFSGLPAALNSILNGAWFIPTRIILDENFGTVYPLWGNICKFFWWFSFFGLGSLLMLWCLLRWKRADSNHLIIISSFVGILLTVLIGSVSVGKISVMHGLILRYLWVSPFVLVPVMSTFLSNFRMRYPIMVFSIIGTLLILPTFLTNADNISADNVYQSEISAFNFLKSSYAKGGDLTFYGFPLVPASSYIITPDASHYYDTFINAGLTQNEIWNSLQDKVRQFLIEDSNGNIAVISRNGKMNWQRYFLIPFNDPNWYLIETALSFSNRIYDNAEIELYSTTP